MNLCNSNCLLLTRRARPCWRHLVSEPRKHPGLWNCSRPETSKKKQLFLMASISIIHGPFTLLSYTSAPLRPASTRNEKEGEHPGTGWVSKWAPQPQEWSPVFHPDSPLNLTVSLLLGNGTWFMPRMGQLVPLPLQSLPALSTSPRGAGISQAALARREDSTEQCQTCWQ